MIPFRVEAPAARVGHGRYQSCPHPEATAEGASSFVETIHLRDLTSHVEADHGKLKQLIRPVRGSNRHACGLVGHPFPLRGLKASHQIGYAFPKWFLSSGG